MHKGFTPLKYSLTKCFKDETIISFQTFASLSITGQCIDMTLINRKLKNLCVCEGGARECLADMRQSCGSKFVLLSAVGSLTCGDQFLGHTLSSLVPAAFHILLLSLAP